MGKKIALITRGSRALNKKAAEHLAKSNIDSVINYYTNEADAKKPLLT